MKNISKIKNKHISSVSRDKNVLIQKNIFWKTPIETSDISKFFLKNFHFLNTKNARFTGLGSVLFSGPIFDTFLVNCVCYSRKLFIFFQKHDNFGIFDQSKPDSSLDLRIGYMVHSTCKFPYEDGY